jgi:hypothetical protein
MKLNPGPAISGRELAEAANFQPPVADSFLSNTSRAVCAAKKCHAADFFFAKTEFEVILEATLEINDGCNNPPVYSR